MIRNSGEEPMVIECLKTLPDCETLIAAMGVPVLDILPHPQRGAFSKEDGEAVVDAEGCRV